MHSIRTLGFWLRYLPLLILVSPDLYAEPSGLPAVKLTTNQDGSQQYSVTLQVLGLMTLLTLIPAFIMMMTAFTRIVIVFGILRQAMGLQQTPNNQIIIGLSLFLTIFIMAPVFEEANRIGLQPYLEEKLGAKDALIAASQPFRDFMLVQTRETDLALFVRLSGEEVQSVDTVSFWVLMPAFVTSELKTAFQIGFIIFIPFLIIDMVTASVLMAMGMMMLSPMIISLPFKIMLFVLVDGWGLIIGTLAASYGM